MRVKHHMGALLDEKAGLKAWLGSKAKRSIFSSPWMEIRHWSQGEQPWALTAACGKAHGGEQDEHHALSAFPQES